MKATYKNGIFNFELDGYAVELYKENEIWLDKVQKNDEIFCRYIKELYICISNKTKSYENNGENVQEGLRGRNTR